MSEAPDNLFRTRARIRQAGLEHGYYWVWYDNAWEIGYWDGEDWEVRGSVFSYTIPVGPKWTVPAKPIEPPRP